MISDGSVLCKRSQDLYVLCACSVPCSNNCQVSTFTNYGIRSCPLIQYQPCFTQDVLTRLGVGGVGWGGGEGMKSSFTTVNISLLREAEKCNVV